MKKVTITEQDVQEWCKRNDDDNPLHTDADAAESGPFGQRVVPGMMLLDHVSGLLSGLADEDEDVVLAGVTAARFRDPVLLGETVTISVEIVEEDKRFTAVNFECRVEERDSLVAMGTINIVIK